MKPRNFIFVWIALICMAIPLHAEYPGISMNFSGTGQYGHGTGIPTTLTSLTMEAWVKHSEMSSTVQRYLTLKPEMAVIRLNNTNGQLHFYIKQSNGSLTAVSANVMTTGEWLHVAGTYDGTTLNLYLNGELVATDTAPVGGLYAPDGEFDISGSGERLRGSIDDLRLWSDVRTETEIKANRFKQLTGTESGLVSYWKFDEGSGTTAFDSAGSADATLINITDANWSPDGAPVGYAIGGNITASTTWSEGPVYVFDDITLYNGATLTINPGVEVVFTDQHEIDVWGKISAYGTEQDSILFTALYDDIGWKGIRYINTNADSSRFVHCIFEKAKVSGTSDEVRGSAMEIKTFSKVRIDHCEFRYNTNLSTTSGEGGTLALLASSAKVKDTVFRHNTSTNYAGALYTYYGSPMIDRCQFVDNSATYWGGAVVISNSDGWMNNCIFRSNSGREGGAISILGSSGISIANCVFDGNHSSSTGGAIWQNSNESSVNVSNCTIINNTAVNGGGLGISQLSNITYRNIIIWGNTATTSGDQVYVHGSNNVDFRYCDIEGGLSAFGYYTGATLSGEYLYCFDLDPEWEETEDGYWISGISPCINAGDPETSLSGSALHDINGDPRYYDYTGFSGNLGEAFDRIDVGAVESQMGHLLVPDDTVIDTDQYFDENLYVLEGRTLHVDPGVTLSFYSTAHAYIYGSLSAIGEPDNMITFTSTSSSSRWKGLTFGEEGVDTDESSVLEYCIVEYGDVGSGMDERGANIHAWRYDDLLIRNCVLRNGYSYYGGAMYAYDSGVRLIGTVICDNESETKGRALYFNTSQVDIVNCTITGNTGSASSTAAIYFTNTTYQPTIANCIIWDNGSSPLYPGSGALTNVTYCDIEGTYPGTNNCAFDPSFKEESDTPYDINGWSYCLNAGTPDAAGFDLAEIDIAGNPRIFHHHVGTYDRIDIGAYEHQGYLAPCDFTASDGNNDYPGYVQLFWDYNSNYNYPPMGFKIYRNGINITIVDSDTHAYSDFNALPGQVYSYAVEAYNGEEAGLSAEDSGYLKPNGIISGTILTANNNPVQDIKVVLDPSPGYCLRFENSHSPSLAIEDPGTDMRYNYTIEFWARTPLSNTTLLKKGIIQFQINSSGNAVVTNGSNSLTQAIDSVSVVDNDWHHWAVVSDYSNSSCYLYVDEYIVASSTSFALCTSSTGNILSGTSFDGYLDDIRLWSAARDSSDIVDGKDIIAPCDEDGLDGYWTLNEGTGTTIFDATSNAHNGVATNCEWSAQDPDIQLGAFTDEWGDYMINQIPYGSSTTFIVVPTKVGHIFQPEQRSVTLSQSNIAQNGIDFTDNSMIPISGYAKYQGTTCPVENATVYLNGSMALPVTMTDEDGYYVIEVEHGTNSIISLEFNDHIFNRSWDLGVVTYPRTNINFEDTFKTQFQADVVGGTDSYPIGDFNLTINSVNGYYNRVVTGQDWSTGSVIINNLPPLDFHVTVDPGDFDPFGLVLDEQFQSMKTQDIDLTNTDETIDTLSYVWRAPLNIEVAWPDTLELKHFADYPESEFYVLPQNEWCSLVIKACEDYSYEGHPDQKTYLVECDLTINDEIGTQGETTASFDGEAEYTYEFAPYTPNIQGGYDRQYQNMIEITVEDTARNRFATQTDWVLTEGIKPLESTYATTSPEIPFLILHDPPGDCSYASFNQSSSHTMGFGVSVCTDMEENTYSKIHLGADLTTEEGLLFSVENEIDITADMNMGFTMGMHQGTSLEQEYTFTTSEEYTTSESDDIIGDFGADVFVGGALNLIWGITKVLSWDDEANDAILEQNVMVSPDGFATVYVYTESQIENSVIPNLLTIGDTESADRWQSYLDMNEYNKEHAQSNPNHPNNISFCAGPAYTYVEETSTTMSTTFEFEMTVGTEFGEEFGMTVDGVGGETGYTFSTQISFGVSASNTFETTTTSTFVLADDDVASDLTWISDYFTTDIGVDPVYGTPVFNLVSGASSAHWEPNTQPRDGVMLTANTYTATDIPSGGTAAFLLYLSNTSQTDEARRYFLTVQHGTNPVGATVKINGVSLEERMAFDLDAGETRQAVLTVEQGVGGYELEGLTLEFYAEGDRGYDGPEGHYFDVFKSFNIYWEAPYSRVSIGLPQDNWLLNQNTGDSLSVMLTDYDLTKPTFRSLKLQYKHPQDVNWLPGFEIPRDSLASHPNYIFYPWDVSGIPDGLYEIRAVATDSLLADFNTESLSGTIDRNGPDVMGDPQPLDGILDNDDEISITFVEEIDPTTVNVTNISVVIVDVGNMEVDCELDCYENKVAITPRIANYWLENHTVRVEVANICDIHGNPMEEPVDWEFYVNANPVNWETAKIEVIKPLGEELIITTRLINNGGQLSSFTIEDLPVWLTVSPDSGQLLPLDSETITFTVSDQIGFGTYMDTVYADIPSLGSEVLVFDIGVIADPPEWSTVAITGYDYSMSITGKMSIEGELSGDLNDVIGAFVQNTSGQYECRGYAQTEKVPGLTDAFAFFLTIHSDEEYGEDILFRVWDASECKEHFGIEESYTFIEGAVYGMPSSPVVVHASPELVRDISCSTGWTWLSTNLENQTSMSVDTLLESLTPQNGDLIKNQTEYAQYVEGSGWIGSLTEIETTEMVKLKLAQSDELTLNGLLADPYTSQITYGSGWNWIGYIPHVSVSVTEALADIDNPVNGDLIKNQHGYAQYLDGYGWIGSLLFMNPGDGYMLHTENAGTFHYPDYELTRGLETISGGDRYIASTPEVPGWDINPLNYEYSANITGVLWRDSGLLLDDALVIGAFSGDECRGIAGPIEAQDQLMYFLTIYSNDYLDTITFKIYNTETGVVTGIEEEINFISNQIIGDPLDPYHFELPSGIIPGPQNLRITIVGNVANLSWNSCIGAQSYRVYSSDDPEAEDEDWVLVNTVVGTSCSCNIVGTCRYYRVTAVMGTGWRGSTTRQ